MFVLLHPLGMNPAALWNQSISTFLIWHLSFQGREKSDCCQSVENGGTYQAKGHPQESIHNAENHGFLQSINPGTQHQRTEAVHSRFIPVADIEEIKKNQDEIYESIKKILISLSHLK